MRPLSLAVQGSLEVVGGIILIVEHLKEALSILPGWRSKSAHVVTLGLEPVHWLLSALVTLGKITSAPG